MSKPDSPLRNQIRNDGWTLDRQLTFLDMLARTRSVTCAARAVGMSREGAYRLRRRLGVSLFAAAWDRALGPTCQASARPAPSRTEVDEGHRRAIAAACFPERPGLLAQSAKRTTS